MPEQPDDPLHYEMKIPPEPNPKKQRGPAKPPSDQNENQGESNTARDTGTVRREEQPQSGRHEK